MKKILTAIGRPILNNKLKENKEFLVLAEDIKSDEELIEILEREEVEILFLSSNIIKNYKIEEFINIIQKLKKEIFIAFFYNQDNELKIKQSENIEVYNDFELELKQLEKFLQKCKKNIIYEVKNKTIAITGANGVGKSVFSTNLAKNVEKQNSKTLLIDFDLEESQIRTLFKIKKKTHYTGNINDILIKINKNLDIICDLDVVFEKRNNLFKIYEILNEFKKKYDLIIIDTSSKLENSYIKRVLYNCDEIIFLIEPNILGVRKSKNLLEVFEKDWKISTSKINIVLNKANIYQISDDVIKELFPDINFLGKMKYNDKYNLMINKYIDKKEITKEYEKIYKKMCSNMT